MRKKRETEILMLLNRSRSRGESHKNPDAGAKKTIIVFAEKAFICNFILEFNLIMRVCRQVRVKGVHALAVCILMVGSKLCLLNQNLSSHIEVRTLLFLVKPKSLHEPYLTVPVPVSEQLSLVILPVHTYSYVPTRKQTTLEVFTNLVSLWVPTP